MQQEPVWALALERIQRRAQVQQEPVWVLVLERIQRRAQVAVQVLVLERVRVRVRLQRRGPPERVRRVEQRPQTRRR
jgi:hypothetical protein